MVNQLDGHTVILAGLKRGEQIVASGNFLGAAMASMMAGMDMGGDKK